MSEPGWSVVKRVAFRWALVAGALLAYPFPIGALPGTRPAAAPLRRPLAWAADWFAQAVLGLPSPSHAINSSGDHMLDYLKVLVIAIIATLAAIAWSVLDRRRAAYPRLARGASVVLRYYLASVMLQYGLAKILRLQFPEPYPGWLYQRLGDSSPMFLLWNFMGHSKAYTVFAGIAEAVGGVLLLWPRTAMLGALAIIVVMTNVVLLNFCYDVPVKLYSLQLLMMAGVIALPVARRLFAAVTGRAVGELPPRPRMSPRAERVRRVAKIALLAALASRLYLDFHDRDGERPEVFGLWMVDSFLLDGVEQPPLVSDPARWRALSIHTAFMAVWLMDDNLEGPADTDFGHYRFELDAVKHTLTVSVDATHKTRETWTYRRPDPDRLVLDGMHRGRTLHVTLHRRPDGLLVTRGFHWINEVPFNR